MKNRKQSEKTKRKISATLMGHKHSEDTKRKIGKSNKGKKLSGETKKKMSESRKYFYSTHNVWNKGIERSKETKQKISRSLKGRIFSEVHKKKLALANSIAHKGCKHSEETKKKMSLVAKIRCNTPEFKFLKSNFMKELWQKPEYQKIQALAYRFKPNKPEKYLIELLNKNFPNEYKYVGDFQFWLGGKNPDFLNINRQKKLIELYGYYWHKDENPKNRIRHFKKYGFDTLIIWEKELKNTNRLTKKLESFHMK